jgi:hypothetical protein
MRFNDATYSLMLDLSVRYGGKDHFADIVHDMVRGHFKDPDRCLEMTRQILRFKNYSTAQELLESLHREGVQGLSASYEVLIDACMQRADTRQVWSLCQSADEHHEILRASFLDKIAHFFLSKNHPIEARSVCRWMQRQRVDVQGDLLEKVAQKFMDARRLDDVLGVARMMQSEHCAQLRGVLAALIQAQGEAHDMPAARAAFELACQSGLDRDSVIVFALMRAYRAAGAAGAGADFFLNRSMPPECLWDWYQLHHQAAQAAAWPFGAAHPQV